MFQNTLNKLLIKIRNACLVFSMVIASTSGLMAMPPGGWNPAGATISSPANGSIRACSTPIRFTGETGNGTAFMWNFGDGTTASGQSVSHAYSSPGTYTVSLRVTGSQDGTPTQASTKTISLLVGNGGSVYPKYVILGLDYAPPGRSSFVSYGTGTTVGSSHSFTRSVSNTLSLTAEFMAHVFGSGVKGELSSSWTQARSVTNARALEIIKQQSHTVPGPLDSSVGVDHDFDLVWLWLNPKIDMIALTSTNLHWTFSNDPNDVNYSDLADIQYVYVKWLKNPSLMAQEAPQVAARLARTWAGVNGGLTSQDFATIASINPFWNGAAAVDSARFESQLSYPLQYEPPPTGGQPITQTYSVTQTATSTQTVNASASYTVGVKITGSIGFLSFLSSSTSIGDSITLTNSVVDEIKNASTTVDSLSITGPNTGYTGLTNIRLYADKVYGTYMFSMIN